MKHFGTGASGRSGRLAREGVIDLDDTVAVWSSRRGVTSFWEQEVFGRRKGEGGKICGTNVEGSAKELLAGRLESQ